jgi:hypothetical protein
VTTPNPPRAAAADDVEDRRRLRIVHDHEVVVALERRGVLRRAVEVGGALVVAQPGPRSLQTFVNRLRGAEELGLARDHAPVHRQPEIAKQRHAGAQQLRYAAAIGGGGRAHRAAALPPRPTPRGRAPAPRRGRPRATSAQRLPAGAWSIFDVAAGGRQGGPTLVCIGGSCQQILFRRPCPPPYSGAAATAHRRRRDP